MFANIALGLFVFFIFCDSVLFMLKGKTMHADKNFLFNSQMYDIYEL